MTDDPGRSVYGRARQGVRTRLAERVARRSRARRRELFRRLIRPGPDDAVVDVGCGELGLAGVEPDLAITGVDLAGRPNYPREFVQADARDLPFTDGQFAVAYSNSLIEHVVDPADRARCAAEIRRVGRRYFVQTPNRWFPVEPHALLPLVHFLPRSLGKRVWRLGVSTDPYEDTRLLGARELRELFPDGEITRERVGPLTKSLVVTGPSGRAARA